MLERDDKSIFEDEAPSGMPPKEEKRKVLLIAIHNHELKKHRNILNRTSLEAKCFEIEIFSTLRSSVYDTRLPLIIIDIGARTSKFYIVEHGIVLRSLFINQGGQLITQAIAQAEGNSVQGGRVYEAGAGVYREESGHPPVLMALVTDEIFTEANNAIVDFEQRYRHSISKIILTGGGASMKGILEEARLKTKIEVEVANPFGRLSHPAFFD